MPRCRKILANGKRCKAAAMTGSKFCLFHTPGQKMKRRKKRPASSPSNKSKAKSRLSNTLKNQAIGRGSKALGNSLVIRGAFLQSNRSISYTKTKFHAARYNVQGTRIVGAHTQRTFMMRRTADGRDFIATQTRANKRMVPHHIHMGKRVQLYGRLIPVLGVGVVMYNMYANPGQHQMREGEGFWQMAAIYGAQDVTDHYKAGGDTTQILTGGKTSLTKLVGL